MFYKQKYFVHLTLSYHVHVIIKIAVLMFINFVILVTAQRPNSSFPLDLTVTWTRTWPGALFWLPCVSWRGPARSLSSAAVVE